MRQFSSTTTNKSICYQLSTHRSKYEFDLKYNYLFASCKKCPIQWEEAALYTGHLKSTFLPLVSFGQHCSKEQLRDAVIYVLADFVR